MRRVGRHLGTLLIAAGIGTLAWAGVTWTWGDPFTSVYTQLEQRTLAESYEARADSLDLKTLAARPVAKKPAAPTAEAKPSVLTPEQRRELARVAARYRRSLAEGDAVARLRVPRLDVDMVMVEGTRSSTLKKGPGRYSASRLPGEGHLIYVAGHRTTYSAPFAHIDALRKGDRVLVELPYGTFEYRITRPRKIVEATALEVLRSSGREEIVLQACHPRFFATHRYLAYAEPVRAKLGDTWYRYASRK